MLKRITSLILVLAAIVFCPACYYQKPKSSKTAYSSFDSITTSFNDTLTTNQKIPQTTLQLTTPSIPTDAPVTSTVRNTTSLQTTTAAKPVLPKPESLESIIASTGAESAFVYDIEEGTMLASKGPSENIIPASITKLLTSLFVLEHIPCDLVMTAGQEIKLIDPDSSVAKIKVGYKLTVLQLIKGMLLPSGNDAAYMVAAGTARYLSGDEDMPAEQAIEYFMNELNLYAKEIGCIDTYYTTPDGLAGPEHYTSMRDLALVGSLAVKNDIIYSCTQTLEEEVTFVSGQTKTWTNSNLLMHDTPDNSNYCPYVTGLKTGSLTGNYCLLVSAEIEGKIYLVGVFKSPTRKKRFEDGYRLVTCLAENIIYNSSQLES